MPIAKLLGAAGLVLVLCLALIMLVRPASSAAPSVQQTIKVGGLSRGYRLFIPPALPHKPAPVFVILHGAGSTAAQMESYSNFDAFAARHGLVAVYPQGINKRWNDGRAFSRDATESADDVEFLRLLIARLVSAGTIDPRRVYVAGISNGGFMALHAACLMAGAIAGIAVIAAAAPVNVDCPSPRPMPVIIFHGTGDRLVPFHGGPIGLGMIDRGAVSGNAATAAFWSRLNRCAAGKVTDLPPTAGMRVSIRSYTCPPGQGLENVIIQGGGHTWPGAHQGKLVNAILGPVTDQIDANELMWRVFQSQTAQK